VSRSPARRPDSRCADLADLKKAGVDLTKTVKSQIDVLMPAVEANEGLITGIVVPRTP